MTVSIDTLTTPLTLEDARAAIYAYLAARGVTTTTWKPGAVVRTLILAFAMLVAALSQLQAAIAKSGFLLLAAGDWLTLVALYVYGVVKDTGTFATGNVTLTNSGGGVYSGAAGDLIVTNSSTGKSYRNTAPYALGAHATITVAVEALELGSASTSAAAGIDTLTTPLLGVTVTNPGAIVGRDAEDDETLRLRCSEKTGALSPNGPRDAYAYFARSTLRADGTAIGVTRVKVVADGSGGVAVTVATASGGVTGTQGDPATDLGAIYKAMEEHAAPLAVTLTAASATALPIATTYEIWVSDATTLTDTQIRDAISAALGALYSSRPIGGDDAGMVYVSLIESRIGAAIAETLHLVVTVPAADVAVGATQAPVAGAVTCTAIHRVPGGIL